MTCYFLLLIAMQFRFTCCPNWNQVNVTSHAICIFFKFQKSVMPTWVKCHKLTLTNSMVVRPQVYLICFQRIIPLLELSLIQGKRHHTQTN